MSDEIKKELKYLKEIGMLIESDSLSNLTFGSYNYIKWSDLFWRLRKRHETRPDPELPFIQKSNPKRILELGSAYGRFTRKVLELDSNIEVTGIELNSSFGKYISLYIKEFPILKKANFILFDILEAEKHLKNQKFDIIIIPMHTFPGFSYDFILNLLPILRNLLEEYGEIIFSTYKFDEIEKNKSTLFEEKYEGGLSLEKNEDNISSQIYYFPSKKTNYGYRRIYYIVYTTFNKEMSLLDRVVTRSIRDIISKDALSKIIRNQNFNINYIERTSISDVYSISKL